MCDLLTWLHLKCAAMISTLFHNNILQNKTTKNKKLKLEIESGSTDIQHNSAKDQLQLSVFKFLFK